MRWLLLVLAGLTGCSTILGIDDLHGPGDDVTGDGGNDTPGPAVDCKAQRLVHLAAGNGGFAWFTQEWPLPFVIENFQPTFAFDNPGRAVGINADTEHPLFVRLTDTGALWQGTGSNPNPTVFVAGNNETHTASPVSVVESGPNALGASAASIQSSLEPALPVLAFTAADSFGTAPNAPTPAVVTDVDSAIDVLKQTGKVTPAIEAELRPSTAQLARYFDANTPNNIAVVATQLAFTANAFRFNLIGTVAMRAFSDDPHGAFQDGTATTKPNAIAKMLDAFYADLAANNELTCGNGGNFLSLADNTVFVAFGDTYKDPFDRAQQWGDGTPQNSNLLYMRSNGFIKQGWFGGVTPAARENFDPATGAILGNGGGSATVDSQAAVAATLYAVARGNRMLVGLFTQAEFSGTIAQ